MTRGFTLVELVITIALAALIGVPVGNLLAQQLTGALRARDYAVAMSLARHEMERLESLDFCDADLTVNAPAGQVVDPYLSGYPYALTRIIWCQAGAGDCTSVCDPAPVAADNAIKRIDIIVARSGSTDRSAALVTYRTKYVRYGL